MNFNIFDQSTKVGRSRLGITQLSIFTIGLSGTSISTLLGMFGILPMVPMVIGIPTVLVTGLLAIFCLVALGSTISKHTKIDKNSDKKLYSKVTDVQITVRDPRYVSDNSLSRENIR